MISVLNLRMARRPIPLTDKQDVYLQDDRDGPGPVRYQMPCGHAIGQESMQQYVTNVLRDSKTDKIACPECNKEWPYPVVRDVARQDRDQRMRVEQALAENHMVQTARKCPRCGTWCSLERTRHLGVTCPFCARRAGGTVFCWACGRAWTSDGKSCTNQQCKHS